MPSTDTIERLVPEELEPDDVTGRKTLALHLERYAFAARHARPPRMLDIACGVGYGSRLLADRVEGVQEVLGVDHSPEAIGLAREHYAGGAVRFQEADAMRFEDASGFDTIVSLETVEHLPEPGGFLARLRGLLRPGGVLVASVPTTPSVDVNPYHQHDFTERSFRALLAAQGLHEVGCLRQRQPYRPWRTLARREARLADLRSGLAGYYARHPRALTRRIGALLLYGFENRYLTVACRVDEAER